MLRFFAKFQRSRNLILIGFCAILVIGLIAFFIPNTPLNPSGGFSTSASDDGTVVAKVGSQDITLKEYRERLKQLASQFGRGNSVPLAALKSMGMDQRVLDQLIDNRIAVEKASSLNLTATDGEVAEFIKQQFRDEKGNFVGAEEYMRSLRLRGIDVGEFENERRDAITSGKLREFLTSAEQISDREVEEKYKKDNTKVEVAYATVDLEKVRQKYKPSEEELKAYFESHKDQFKATEPVRKVEYIFIPTDDVAKVVPITEEMLRKEYESRKQHEYRASIIKLNILAPQDAETVKKKIDELARRVRGSGGPESKGEDFAAVAKGNSMDPSAAKGGDIGWIKKEPNKTGQWQQRIYTNKMQVGEIEGPFQEGQSWYLMKVTEQREIPFAQMRDTVKATATNNEAFKEASRLADVAYGKATEFKDLRKAAEEIAKQLHTRPETLVKTTPYFKNGDALPDLGKGSGFASNPNFESAISTLKKGEIGDKVSIPGGQAVPQLVDIIENGQQLTFEQARNQVEEKLRREKEPTLGLARAQEIVNQSKNVEDFKRLAKADGLEVKTDTNFSNYSFAGAASGSLSAGSQARAALTSLKEGDVFKTPIKVGTAYLIFAAVKRTEADLSKLSTERENVRSSIKNERETSAYEAFIKSARKDYEQKGEIKIYQDRIDKFFATAAAAQ